MAFYVAVCLIAALAVVGDEASVPILGIIWGSTVGLALAHLFAFRLAARVVGGGHVDRQDTLLAVAQLVGAGGVALVASLPVLLLPTSVEVAATRFLLVGLIAAPAYGVGRSIGATRLRSGVFAALILVFAGVISVVKNVLAGH